MEQLMIKLHGNLGLKTIWTGTMLWLAYLLQDSGLDLVLFWWMIIPILIFFLLAISMRFLPEQVGKTLVFWGVVLAIYSPWSVAIFFLRE